MSPDRRQYVRGNPDTVSSLGLCGVVGVVLTVATSPPPSLVNLTSPATGMVWLVVFTLGALVSLAGVLWHDDLIGWVLELAGRISLGLAALIYATVLAVSLTALGAAVVFSAMLAIGVGSAFRVWQLARRLSEWKAAVRSPHPILTPRRR